MLRVHLPGRLRGRASRIGGCHDTGVIDPTTAIKEKPLRITLLDETITESYIEIVDASSGNRVVTSIEFLSPTNKLPGRGSEKVSSQAA